MNKTGDIQPTRPVCASMILDSISEGVRLTTFEVNVPLLTWVHLLTHRAFSRNAQSNRALSLDKLLEQLTYRPPWTKEGKGMIPDSFITDEETISDLDRLHDELRDFTIKKVMEMREKGSHKEDSNRYLTPFLVMKGLITATDFDNFFDQRLDASTGTQNSTRSVAEDMHRLLQMSEPVERRLHMPFVTGTEFESHPEAPLISVGRCATVSYLNHNNKVDVVKDLSRARKMIQQKHPSPFEHVAVSSRVEGANYANFRAPWLQLRHSKESFT